MNMKLYLSKIIGLVAITLTLTSCMEKKEEKEVPVSTIPQVAVISGGAISVVASDEPLFLTTQEILDDADTPVKDGTVFVVTGNADIQVSADGGVNYLDSIKVESQGGAINFVARTPTQAGTYRIHIQQHQKQNKNANGYFYIDVKPSFPDDLGEIVSSRFEDQEPYNGQKDPNERYSSLADGQTPTQITVGPVIDRFGNLINDGYLRLVVDRGQIVSNNPTVISDGYAIFSFQPTKAEGSVNIKAQAVDEVNGLILREVVSSLIQVKPKLVLSTEEDFGDVVVGTSKDIKLKLKNEGTTYSQGITVRTSAPFSLPNIENECVNRLHPGQECEVTLRVTGENKGILSGNITAQGLPAIIEENKHIFTINARVINPSIVSLTTNSLNFNSACGTNVVQEFYIQNFGDVTLENVAVSSPLPANSSDEATCNAASSSDQATCESLPKCRWSLYQSAEARCTSRVFDIIIPPADSEISGEFANCGNRVPTGGVKCRVQVSYHPKSLISQFNTSSMVTGSGISPLSVNLTANAGVGAPHGNIPLRFDKSELLISESDNVKVFVGPVKDVCGNEVGPEASFTASVTEGSLNVTSGSFIGGEATLTWSGTNDFTKLGEQTVFVNAGNSSNSAKIDFGGVVLTLEGPDNGDIGEVSSGNPSEKVWTVKNDGNRTTGITASIPVKNNFSVTNIDVSQCQALAPGNSCDVKVSMSPIIPANEGAVVLDGVIEIQATSGFGKTRDSLSFKGYGTKNISLGKNETLSYYMGTLAANTEFSRVITLKNNNEILVSSISLDFQGATSKWSISDNTCVGTIAPGATCSFRLNYAADEVAGQKTARLVINTNNGATNIDYSLDIVGNINRVIPTIVQVSPEQLPADGISTAIVTIGPIKDDIGTGNVVAQGTDVFVSAEPLGTIVEEQPLRTDAAGMVTATLKSSDVQIGNSEVVVRVLDDTGIKEIGRKLFKLNGVELKLEPISVQPMGMMMAMGSVPQPQVVNFGEVQMGEFSERTIKLTNSGNTIATGLSFESSDPSVFSIANLGGCQSGDLAAGDSCEITIRFTAPQNLAKIVNTATITVRSLNPAGINGASINVEGTSLLPATLIASKRQLTYQLIPGRVIMSEIVLTNIGDSPVKNFAIQTDDLEHITLSGAETCKDLAGGASCSISVMFNPKQITENYMSLILAFADKTSTQILFSADKLNLAFANNSFTDDVFTCKPVRIEARDSFGNAMSLQEGVIVSISSDKAGTFYRNNACAGQGVTRTNIFASTASSEQLYFIPRIAGKHTLRAAVDDLINGQLESTQENLANIVITPGTDINIAPLGPVELIALGAVGDVTCSFNSNGSNAPEIVPAGKTCLYQAGILGDEVDNIVLRDGDEPANVASIRISTTTSISISPKDSTVDSGEQVMLSARDGSGVNYIYSSKPIGTKKIGSYISGNIFTAGENITGEDLFEEVTVTDSFGAKDKGIVVVKPSIFTEKSISNTGSTNMKSIASWENTMVVGDPNATVDGKVGAGAVYVYKLNSIQRYELKNTIKSPLAIAGGQFGKSVGIFKDKVIIGAPGETPFTGVSNGGGAYLVTLTATGTTLAMESVTKAVSSGHVIANDRWGEHVSITDGFFVVTSKKRVYIYNEENYKQIRTDISCSQAPCPDVIDQEDTSSVSIYSNHMYDGTYLALGVKTEYFNGKENAGVVFIYKLTQQGAAWSWQNSFVRRIVPDDAEKDGEFGAKVSLFGPYLAVGAPGANNGIGKVYVYKRDTIQGGSQSVFDGAYLGGTVTTRREYRRDNWHSFMNSYGIWATDPNAVSFSQNRTLLFDRDGNYTFTAMSDDIGYFFIDGELITKTSSATTPTQVTRYVTRGYHDISFSGENLAGPGGIALTIQNSDGDTIFNTRMDDRDMREYPVDEPDSEREWKNPTIITADSVYRGDLSGARFGSDVVIFGNYLVIGAPGQRNYPYLENINSGSMYVYQRYLSEYNNWEFLGQLRSTQYSSGDLYGSNISVYLNNFYTTDSKGRAFHISGGKASNEWPFGFHGSLEVKSGRTLNITDRNNFKDYSTVTVESGATVVNNLESHSQGILVWGVAGDFQMNGILTGKSDRLRENENAYNPFSAPVPTKDGYPNKKTPFVHQMFRAKGGAGGRSSARMYSHSNHNSCKKYWNFGWSNYNPPSNCGNGGGGLGSNNSITHPTCSAAGAGGMAISYYGGTGTKTGWGATSWSGTGSNGANHRGYGGGGGGGFKGRHGSIFYINAGNFSGTGAFNIGGQNGGNGGNGGHGCTAKCHGFGGGGGGGGGAGGSGGAIYVKSKNDVNSSSFILNGNGGRGGNGGKSDYFDGSKNDHGGIRYGGYYPAAKPQSNNNVTWIPDEGYPGGNGENATFCFNCAQVQQ